MKPALGIIAGRGQLPARLIEACQAEKRPFFVLAFEDHFELALTEAVPHRYVRLGAIGEALKHLRDHGVREVVLAGGIERPGLASLKPDFTATKLLARLGKAFFGGDDALLKALVAFLEDEGFSVVGAGDVLADLLAPKGVLGNIKPDAAALADIAHGLRAAHMLGALDIGQAVVVEHGCILGVEAAEGTDALLARCALLKREKQGGVLVKAKKPGQESRADLPTIGVTTIEQAHKAGLCGIAVEADGSIILDKSAIVTKADMLGLFIVGT